jgi:probable HAF family extracellular repeat protein
MPAGIFSRRSGMLLAALAVLASANAVSAAIEYTVTDLGAQIGPDRPSNSPVGINASGTVVGNLGDVANADARAFLLYANGAYTRLPTLPAPYDFAEYVYAINDNNQVVGESGSLLALIPDAHAFLFSNGGLTDLGTLGGSYSSAIGINDRGQIVGVSSIAGDVTTHAFLYSNGKVTDLGTLGGSESSATAINNNGQVAGYSDTSDGNVSAFLYRNGVMTGLGTLGGTVSIAVAINNKGQVVGDSTFNDSGMGQHAFLYSNGKMIDLGTLGGMTSAAHAINDQGQIVGYSTLSQPLASPFLSAGFIYSNGIMVDLNTLIDPSSSWEIADATGINDSGQIVALGLSKDAVIPGIGPLETLLLTPLPEPSSLALLGLAAVTAIARRRRRARI